MLDGQNGGTRGSRMNAGPGRRDLSRFACNSDFSRSNAMRFRPDLSDSSGTYGLHTSAAAARVAYAT